MFSRGRGGRSDLGDRDARNRGTRGEHSWRAVLWHAGDMPSLSAMVNDAQVPADGETAGERYPSILQVVLDAEDARGLAEFYRQLYGLHYRPGDEPPTEGEADDDGWLVLRGAGISLAFQRTEKVPRSTWPSSEVPQQFHLDTTVPTIDELERQKDRALALGATLLLNRTDAPEEPLYVVADPAGHPLCIFVGD